MDPGGSNLNAGSTSATGAVYTSTAGNWDGTSLFTPTDGQTTTSLVSVGHWASIYPTGNTATPYIAQVTVVGAGVNGTITLSTTAKFGTAPVSGTGTRACKTGGAFADLIIAAVSSAWNTGTIAQATRLNIKAGTYANTTNGRPCALAGTTTAPLWFRGYKTAIGDQDTNSAAVAGTDIPSFTFTTGQFSPTGANQYWSNVDFTGATTSAGGLFNATAVGMVIYRCRFRATTGASQKVMTLASSNVALIASYVSSTVTTIPLCSTAGGGAQFFQGNYFTGGSGGIVYTTGAANAIIDNTFDAIQGDAISFTTGYCNIHNNSIYAPTGNGITWSGTPANPCYISNNHFENVNQASKAGFNNASGTASNLFRLIANSYFGNTANVSGQGDIPLIFDGTTLGASGFNNAAGHDFTPSSLLLATGFPGQLENFSTSRGYMTPGAFQAAGGVSGARIFAGM